MSAGITPASIEADCATLVESLSTLLRCARVSSSAATHSPCDVNAPVAPTMSCPCRPHNNVVEKDLLFISDARDVIILVGVAG